MSSLDEGSNGAKPPTQSWLSGAGFLFVALVLFGTVWFGGTPITPLGRLFYQLAAIFFLGGAGLLAASLTAAARRRGPPEHRVFARRGAKPLLEPFETLRGLYDRSLPILANIDWQGDWYPLLAASLPSLLALYAIYSAWTIAGPALGITCWIALFGELQRLRRRSRLRRRVGMSSIVSNDGFQNCFISRLQLI